MTRRPYSPSQLAVAACQRRWHFRYVQGVKDPRPKPGAEFGARAHKQLELYHRHGTPPALETPEGRAAASGLHLNPPPRTLRAERTYRFHCAGMDFLCIVDLSGLVPDGETALVYDHKFLSDPHKYGLTSESMLEDPQVLMCAAAVMGDYRTGRAQCTWIYYSKSGKSEESFAIVCTITKNHLLEVFPDLILEPAERLEEVRRLPIAQVPPHLGHCHDYNQECAYLDQCQSAVWQAGHTRARER